MKRILLIVGWMILCYVSMYYYVEIIYKNRLEYPFLYGVVNGLYPLFIIAITMIIGIICSSDFKEGKNETI